MITTKRKVLIAAIVMVSAVTLYVSYDFLAARFWLGTFFDAPQEEFVCGNEAKILSEKEQKYREERAKNLSRSMEDAIGFYVAERGAHVWFSISFNKLRLEKLYRLQKLLTIDDWEILSEMYMDKNYRDYYFIIPTLFAVSGERALSILECEINNAYINDEEKKRFLNNLTGIKNQSVDPVFIYRYQEHNNYVDLFKMSSFLILLLIFYLLIPIVVLVGIFKLLFGFFKRLVAKDKNSDKA
ncbi:hypothetical protein FACS189487_09100 [Campylobacterota bacterium]|nr:hypothetical protein FACS189487_09100 [Campylobacterota bacterium]